MANFFQTLFGMGKKNKQEAVPTYFPSQDPRYQLVQKNLEDIIAKRGYGYTPEMISSTTAPYATARRSNFANYEKPLISAEASSRGLGRSTIPINRIALSSQEGERDIEQRIADLTQRSEALKAEQYQSALSGEAGLASAEIQAQQEARNRATAAQEANRASNIAGTQNAAIFGTQAAGPILQGISPFLNLIPGVGPVLSAGANILGGAASVVGNTKNSALVNKGDDELMTMLKSLFAGKTSGKISTQSGSSGAGQLAI